MIYPAIEKKNKELKDRKERETKETELYIDSETIEEFELKRSVEGITYDFFMNDSFKLYYFYRNSVMKYLNDEGILLLLGMATGLSFAFSIFTHTFILIAIAFITGFSGITYFIFRKKCEYAGKLIKNMISDRKEQQRMKNFQTSVQSAISISSYIVQTASSNKTANNVSGSYVTIPSLHKSSIQISFQGQNCSLSC